MASCPLTAPSRNAVGFLQLVEAVESANHDGALFLIADHLTSHRSGPIREWLAANPRIQLGPFPIGACWLNLIEGVVALVAAGAHAGRGFANHSEIETATEVATRQLNRGTADSCD